MALRRPADKVAAALATPKARQRAQIENLESIAKQQQESILNMQKTAEHFLEASRVSLEILGELLPQLAEPGQYTIRARLGVVEDILEGACTRYTDH